MPNYPSNSELIMRLRPVAGDDLSIATTDFNGQGAAPAEAIAAALDQHRSLTLAQARYNREADTNAVIINLANVVCVRPSSKDSAATGQYL